MKICIISATQGGGGVGVEGLLYEADDSISWDLTFQHCYKAFVDPAMLEPLALIFVRHFFVGQTWVLNVLTLSDQQMLHDSVRTFTPGFRGTSFGLSESSGQNANI